MGSRIATASPRHHPILGRCLIEKHQNGVTNRDALVGETVALITGGGSMTVRFIRSSSSENFFRSFFVPFQTFAIFAELNTYRKKETKEN